MKGCDRGSRESKRRSTVKTLIQKGIGPDRPNSNSPIAKGTSPSENVRQKLLAGTTRTRHAENSANHQFPFTDDILATKLPPNWNNPTLDRYDGTTDPDEHIDSYVSQLTLFTTDGYIYCKVFPTSLRGAALNWFTRLPPRSIDSFATLNAKFV